MIPVGPGEGEGWGAVTGSGLQRTVKLWSTVPQATLLSPVPALGGFRKRLLEAKVGVGRCGQEQLGERVARELTERQLTELTELLQALRQKGRVLSR